MATIKRQGKGYKITVSRGYDLAGKQLREHMTWVPAPGMSERQIAKELNRTATLFEEEVKCSDSHDGNMRFKDFSDTFLNDYAENNLKAKTVFGYKSALEIINKALGHIKLKDMKPGHIAAFYANLQESGIRAGEYSLAKIDFAQWIAEHHTSMSEISRKAGVSLGVLAQLKAHKKISKKCAIKVASGMGEAYTSVFNAQHDTQPLSAGTIHVYHRVLSAVLFRAVKWGHIQSNPASKVDLPSIAGRRAAYLDEPDARRLLTLLQSEPIKWRAIVTFDLLSGLRRGELAGLRWQDVNFDDQTITVCQTSNYVPGKGVYVDSPKTATSSRPMRLARSAFLLLLEYKRWQESQRIALGDAWEDLDGRVFTTDCGAPMFPDSITQWFTKFIKRTGLPKVTIHSLRHTYASLMIADGTPLIVVSHQLGHAQSSTTANIYAHVIASAEAKAVETFDRFNDVIAPEEVPAESNQVLDISKTG